MVLRSGKRRSLDDKETKERQSYQTIVKKKEKESKSKTAKTTREEEEEVKLPKKETTPKVKTTSEEAVPKDAASPRTLPKMAKKDVIPVADDENEDEDDEAPDDVGFAASKETFLKEVRAQKEQILEEKMKKKDALKKKLEKKDKEKKRKEKKEKKALKKATESVTVEEDKLPQDLLEQLSKEEEEKKKEQKAQNKRKKFDDEDEDEEMDLDQEMDVEPESVGLNVQVVSRKDERKLNNVAPSVLNFRERMLFGEKNKREPVDVMMRRKEKIAQIGGNVFAAKIIRN